MKGSFIILGCFLAGLLLSVFHIIPPIEQIADYSKYLLYLLMFLVGISLGLDKTLLPTIKAQPIRLLLLPLATMIGTLAGAAIAFVLLNYLFVFLGNTLNGYGIFDVLSVGSGYGYYSLSSIFLNEARGAEIGTIALAANILRELMTILFAPLMAKYFGPFAPISSGGATSMDVTLPIIQKTSGNKYVPLSVYHGIVMDFSVPLYLTLFISLAG
jgi:uncharacterized membrane protein YbjE (DUF340 family)